MFVVVGGGDGVLGVKVFFVSNLERERERLTFSEKRVSSP